MNTSIYATILTGLGIVITLMVTMHNLAKANQQETNRRIDELKKDLRELLDARFKVIDSQFKVVDSQFEVAGVRFQKLEGEVAEVRQGVQDIKKVIFKPAA
jgi:DNA anti-recombination protein RmuC